MGQGHPSSHREASKGTSITTEEVGYDHGFAVPWRQGVDAAQGKRQGHDSRCNVSCVGNGSHVIRQLLP